MRKLLIILLTAAAIYATIVFVPIHPGIKVVVIIFIICGFFSAWQKDTEKKPARKYKRMLAKALRKSPRGMGAVYLTYFSSYKASSDNISVVGNYRNGIVYVGGAQFGTYKDEGGGSFSVYDNSGTFQGSYGGGDDGGIIIVPGDSYVANVTSGGKIYLENRDERNNFVSFTDKKDMAGAAAVYILLKLW